MTYFYTKFVIIPNKIAILFHIVARAFVAIICIISFLFSEIENTITYQLLTEKTLQLDTSFRSKATVIASIASLILLIGKKYTQTLI